MQRFLEIFCVVKNDKTDSFRLGPAIVMFLLILIFIGASIYILINCF